MMESLIPEYDYFGYMREPSGSALPGIAPTNAYLCRDGKYVLIGGNGDGIFKRLMNVMGREDLGNDQRFAHNDGRAKEAAFLDAAIEEWTKQHDLEEILERTEPVGVPVGYPYTAADIVADPHYQAREMIQTIDLPSGKTSEGAGRVAEAERHAGPNWRRRPGAGSAHRRGARSHRHR